MNGLARLGVGGVVVCLLAGCGGGGSRSRTAAAGANPTIPELAALEPYHLVNLDTAGIAARVRAGGEVELPFVTVANEQTSVVLRLVPRNLRSPELRVADVKDGVARKFRTIALPAPATYQGRVKGRAGSAVFTINEQVVEGNVLAELPGGWSIIEPLEPLLRLRGVDLERRAALLRQFNHIVYNVRAQRQRVKAEEDLGEGTARAVRRTPVAPRPVVVTTVGDGDAGFYSAYPPDSVMPFWLKEEALFNVLDWLFSCLEPNGKDDAISRCDNEFDGGSDGFDARVQLDRLEVWAAGGPDSANRDVLLRQTARQTHQATPPCCGEPHTAGRSSMVFFFSGRTLANGVGVASVAGLAIYGDSCLSDSPANYLCHHALTQVTPSSQFPGSAFYQEILVAHEVGHIIGAGDDQVSSDVSWLFLQQKGFNLMSNFGLDNNALYLYTRDDTHNVMGPLLQERLGGHHP